MREIKFRGKDKRGTWRYGYFCKTNYGKSYIKENQEDFEVTPETVGQFTGLTITKKDVEVYFDDIIKIGSRLFVVSDKFVHGITLFCPKTKRNYLIVRGFMCEDAENRLAGEIIGNTTDNSELL